ncbi:MAG: PQQ-binding-like beta-propeller repeat protein [Planctomycetales bacterium]|nr:PQQ-binding-like beta-propeller repeat protein [Planctomycetales bacterium]
MRSTARYQILLLMMMSLLTRPAVAADWPMWRHDARRSASTPESLAPILHRQWTRHLPKLQGAWLDQDTLTADAVYQPIAAGGLLLIGSSYDDSLSAWDLATGTLRWRFYTDGPIRYAPAAANGRVYLVADDGCLYCLELASGKQLFRVCAAPRDQRVLGNSRLISAWPARGGPVLADGQVYFAASIWPFMGIFIQAVDAQTGTVTWRNDGTGSTYILQPHNSPAFAGLAPQGYLAASGDALIVPNGRSVPARLNRKTGQLEYFRLSLHRSSGGDQVAISGNVFLNGGAAFDLKTGLGIIQLEATGCPVLADGLAYTSGNRVTAIDVDHPEVSSTVNKKGVQQTKVSLPEKWTIPIKCKLFLKAGSRLYGSHDRTLLAIDPPTDTRAAKLAWSQPLEGVSAKGSVAGMLVADGRLVVVTTEGAISCYGADKVERPVEFALPAPTSLANDDPSVQAAEAMIETLSSPTGGIAVVLGLDDGNLMRGLAHHPRWQVIGVDGNARRVEKIRHSLDAAGVPRNRVAVHHADPLSIGLPPYLAHLVTTENLEASGFDKTERFVARVFGVLRPYGGRALLPLSNTQNESLAVALASQRCPGHRLASSQGQTILSRPGPLPGSAAWTHQYADVGNTSVSNDDRVKAPLGLLWFGGSSNHGILPRHGHGPTEQVVGGRLFIEGPDLMRAVDVYTGRVLWEVSLPGVGRAFNFTGHQPGANATGSNYVSTEDAVYVAYQSRCVKLDSATGEVIAEFPLPPLGSGPKPKWGYIAVTGDLLIAGAEPLVNEGKRVGSNTHDGTTSRFLVVMDRHNGKVLWTREAHHAFGHNAIVASKDLLYVIDRLPETIVALMARRGRKPTGKPRLVAFNARTGQEAWSTTENVFGTWLGLSTQHNLLLQCGRPARDMLTSEPDDRMIVYQARSGKIRWDKKLAYSGPCLLRGETIITQGQAVSLLTGEPITRTNPLTGLTQPWGYTRNYGCNSAVASRHLLTFRSAAAGYFDLTRDGGTGNLGGFRSSCSSNLICADGVLNAPDYTRTCNCSYQNQSSLALVHDPRIEMWTFNQLTIGNAPLKHLGLNLGAPGDRPDDDGTLWLEYPVVGGPSPKLQVTVKPASVKWFLGHSERIDVGPGGGPTWVGASGARGIHSIEIGLPGKATYKVSLHFTEPDRIQPGERRFSIHVGGKLIHRNLDLAASVGVGKTLSVDIDSVEVEGKLDVKLTPAAGSRPPVLSGVEIHVVQ